MEHLFEQEITDSELGKEGMIVVALQMQGVK
jgi:hypothetical protein